MKILQIRFKNLNSLYGEWSLDLTQPEYVSDGIFAITGPTGAGKSTILDAICIALYGRTPRLKSITKSGNEIMSRQTGECFAEVTFETGAGKFRCHWSQHKARKKGDGNLLDSQHEIVDVLSGRVLETKKREVANVIEAHTGMNFDRFVQSMLLAQGGFDAFLHATSDQKAPILEQITGTEIYSEISKRVHDRQRSEHGKREILLAETAGIAILSVDDEVGVNKELDAKQKVEEEQSFKNLELTKSILWLKGITSLNKELVGLDRKIEVVSSDLKGFESSRARLQWALKAFELDSYYATLSSKREQQKRELDFLDLSEKQFPGEKKGVAERESELKKQEEGLVETKKSQRVELELIKKVRALDLRMSEKAVTIKAAEEECRKFESQGAQTSLKRQKVEKKEGVAREELSKLEKSIASNSQSEALVSQLTGINELIKNYQTLRSNHAALVSQSAERKKLWSKDSALYVRQEKAFNALKGDLDKVKIDVEEARNSLVQLLGKRQHREYKSEYEGLLREMAYIQKIATLEEEREKLLDDKPCPLCGSLAHPFSVGTVPKPDETEKKINDLSKRLKKVDELEIDIKNHETLEKKRLKDLTEAEKKLVQAQHKKEEGQSSYERFKKDISVALNECAELKEVVLKKIKPFDLVYLSDIDIAKVPEVLRVKLQSWEAWQKQKIDIEKQNIEFAIELKGLDSILSTTNESLREKQGVLAGLKVEQGTLFVHRKGLYGDKKPDKEEHRLEKLIALGEKGEKEAREQRDIVKLQLEELKTRISALTESTDKRKEELGLDEMLFTTNLNKAGFDDEKQFFGYRLSQKERERLNSQARELDHNIDVLTTRKKEVELHIRTEMGKNNTEKPLEELTKEQTEIQESLKVMREEAGALKQKLVDNSEAKIRYLKKGALIEAQKIECARWEALHSLIGSADGKKYRNFAQGLTFELMVSHANRQLEKMTDRYLLVRDEQKPLELMVIDNYQAGEIRSTKNLSGGESFIVSLSLALGLSKMASRHVRVDSLFLDEGFGALDEEALEMALDALSKLYHEGKLIGIISHVPALHERISTQINVLPISGGKSAITGPGCKRVE